MAILEGGYRYSQNRPMSSAEKARMGRPRQPNGLTPPGTPQQVGAFSRHPTYPNAPGVRGDSGRIAPDAPQGPQINPATNYDALFRASIDSQRGQIDSQIRAAMASVAQREADAQALVARQPGEVNANFDAAQPALDQMKKTVADSNGALHVQSFDDPNAAMNPIVAAVAATKAGRLSDLPYLQAGTNEIFTRQRGQLDQAGLAAKGELDARMSDYMQQNAMADREDARAEKAAKAEQDTFYAHTMFQRNLDREDARNAQRAADQKEKKALAAAEPSTNDPEYWSWMMRAHPNQAQSIISSPAYKNAVRLRQKGEYTADSWADQEPGNEHKMSGVSRNRLTRKQIRERFKGRPKLIAALRARQYR